MKTNSQQVSCFVSKYSSKQFPLPTQFRSFPMTHCMSQSNAITTAVRTNILGYLMHLRNQINVPKQANTVHSRSVVNQQSQHQVPLCLQCHDGSYLSFSQHSNTYTARQTIMLQAPISRSPVSGNVRQAPLFLHTTEPQVFNYTRIALQNVATKPRSLTKQTRPSVVLMPTLLNPVTTKPRSPTLRGSHAKLSQLCGN